MSDTRIQLYALAMGLAVGLAIGMVNSLIHPDTNIHRLPVKAVVE